MDVDTVMIEVAALIDTIPGLRVVDHPVDTIAPPVAIVGLPEITFDETYGRGADRYLLPVILAVGRADAKASRFNIAPYVKGSGATSVKAALEPNADYVSFDSLRVQGVSFDVITWSAVDYLCATFLLDIIGDGA